MSFVMKVFRQYVVEYVSLLWDLLQPESFRESWVIKSSSNIIPARFRSKQNANHRQPFTTPNRGVFGRETPPKKKRSGETLTNHPPTQKTKPKTTSQNKQLKVETQVQVSGQHRSSTTRLACRQRTCRHSQTC